MQKMIVLTFAIDVIFILAAFLILLFDKKNTANAHSKNIKSYFVGRRDMSIMQKSAMLFIDIVMYSIPLIVLELLFKSFGTNLAVFIPLSLMIISLCAIFPVLFLKTVVLTKKIAKV